MHEKILVDHQNFLGPDVDKTLFALSIHGDIYKKFLVKSY